MKIIKRILGLIVFVFIILLLIVYLMRNTLIEYFGGLIATEKYGAKIDIDGVDFDVFKGNIKVSRVQITDKNNTMRNIGDIRDINLDIEYKPILLKKLITVDDLTLGLVEILTPRKEDGGISTTEIVKISEKTSSIKVENSVKKTSNLDLNSLKSLEFRLSGDNYRENLEKLDLKIVREYEEEQVKIKEIYSYWDEKITGDEYKEKLDLLNERYKSIEERIKVEKNPLNLVKEIGELKNIVDEINSLIKNIEGEKRKFESDLNTIKSTKDKAFRYIKSDDYFKDIVGWDEEDLKIEINSIINNYVKKYLDKNIDVFEEFKNKGTNQGGEEGNAKPPYDILIKQTNITFKHLNYKLVGDAQNIASKEEIVSEPIKFKLVGDDQKIKANLVGEISQNKENLNIKMNISGLEIDENLVQKNENLSILVGSKVNIGYNMVYEKNILDIFGSVDLSNINFDLKYLKIDDKIKNILDDGISGIKTLNLTYKYAGKSKKLSVDSDITSKISEVIEKVLKTNLEKYKQEAKKLVEIEIKKYTDKLNLEIGKVEGLEKILDQNSIKLKQLGIETKSKQDSEIKGIKSPTENLKDSLKKLFK